MYFEQAVSSTDGTITSLNTIFSSNFQVANAVMYQKIVLNENNLINILKKNGYHVYGIFPNLTSFNSLRECFENENNSYDWIEPNIPSETLPTGLAKKIIRLLESKKQEPCFYYFHIFDLHPLREGRKPIGIENFDNEKFGSSLYERTVSAIDFWLAKILEYVDLDNTIVILTADHGERIPHGGLRRVDFEPKEIQEQVRHVDFMPTILDQLNIELDESFKPLDGVSLIPLINGKPFDEKIAYTETANPLDANVPPKKPNTKSVRTSKWKFILNEYNNTKELYDLENDPDELENIAGNGLEMEEVLFNELNKLQKI